MLRTYSSPASLLHLWDVVDDTIVTTEGVYIRGFELTGLDSEHLPSDALMTAAGQLYEGMKADLEDDMMCQLVLTAHSNYDDLFQRFAAVPRSDNEVLNLQRRLRLQFLRSRRPAQFSTHLFVGSMRGFGVREFKQLSHAQHAEKLEEARRLGRGVSLLLERADIRTRVLDRAQIEQLFAEGLSPDRRAREGEDRTLEIRRDSSIRTLSRRERFFDAPIFATDDSLRIGTHCIKVLSLRTLPAATHFTLMEAFLHLAGDFRLSVVLSTPNQSATLHNVRIAHRLTNADAHRSAHVQDAERAGRLREADLLASLLAESKQKLVLLGMQLVLWGDSPKALEERVLAVSDELKQYQLAFVEETGRHDVEYMKTLPGMAVRFDRWKLMPSNNAVDLLPVFGGCPGDRRPVLLVRTGRGELFSYDPVEPARDNWNACVFGASGSGKSVFMNMLITSAMLANHTRGRLIVVDFAGATKSSYRMVAKLFGGRFVPVLGQNASLAINPFPPRRVAIEGDGAMKAEILSFLSLLTDMLIVNTGADKDAQLFRNLIERAIGDAYRESDEPGYAPTYTDVLLALKSYENRKELDRERASVLVSLLEGFLRSPDAALFSRRSSIEIDSDFVIFDLFGIDGLRPNVQQAVAYAVSYFVKSLAFDAGDPKTKYVVLDEVAQLLRRPEMTALVHELYSTARKHNTSIWTVTQKYSDYVASAVAGTINLNSTTQLFLSHARAASVRKQIAEDFELNERDAYLFETLRTKKGEFSEALLRTEIWDEDRAEKRAISQKLRIELSPFDYELATSDSSDREVQRRFIEAHPELGLEEALLAIAKAKAKDGQRREAV